MKSSLPIVVLFLVLTPVAFAGSTAVYAEHGMVVSAEPHATQAGVEILEQGGNAFGFALAVSYPRAGNLGGGGFMVALTQDRKRVALNFREKAPLAATRDMYLDDEGNLIDGLSTDTLLAVGVPGSVHGLLRAQEDYGKLSRKKILAPAIRLAKKGFVVDRSMAASLRIRQPTMTRFASTAAAFYPGGNAPVAGDILKQPDLARTLTAIRSKGAPGFYEGRTADLLVEYMEKNGGIITHEDLRNYSSQYRDPVVFNYKGYELVTHPLPSSGGITLGQILKLVEPFPLQKMGYHGSAYIRTIVEAERLAYADRNHHLGDADFVDVPESGLISDTYIAQRRKRMPKRRAGKSTGVRHGSPESTETTHYCVVDRDRNVVAVTTTLNGSYGMQAVVEGAGFLLNNEMDDFSAKPGQPNMFGLVQGEKNAIEPGKRMLSSMTPTIVLKDGAFDFTMGTPGGATIITTNAQILLNIVEFGMNIREAIDAPRFHHQHLPDRVDYETFALSPDTIARLQRMGYTLNDRGSIGLAEGIQVTDDGWLAGYTDRRGSGLAAGY